MSLRECPAGDLPRQKVTCHRPGCPLVPTPGFSPGLQELIPRFQESLGSSSAALGRGGRDGDSMDGAQGLRSFPHGAGGFSVHPCRKGEREKDRRGRGWRDSEHGGTPQKPPPEPPAADVTPPVTGTALVALPGTRGGLEWWPRPVPATH